MRALAAALLLIPLAARAELEVSADPPRIVLGVQSQVTIKVKNVTPGKAVHSFASRGALSPTTRQGGEAAFLWTPPQSHVPDTALFAFWTEGATPEVGILALPLLGRTDLQADTEPGATVTVEIGGASFGPVKANKKGHVSVPIEVPPNTKDAKVISVSGEQKTTKEVTLDAPPSNPLAVTFTAEPLTAKSKNWLIVLEAEAFPPDAIGIQFTGATSALRATHPGWALYEVVPEGGPIGVDVRVDLKDHPEARAEAHATVTEPPQPPEPPHTPRPWYPSLEVGGFYGGSSNGGVVGALGAGYGLPIPKIHTWVEAQAGLRSLGFSGSSAGNASFDASIVTLPVEISLRGELFARGAFSLDLRLGGGIEAFWMTLSNVAAPQPQSSSGAVPEGLFGLEAVFAAGSFDLFIELRGMLATSMSGHDPNAPNTVLNLGQPLSGAAVLAGLRLIDR